MATPGRPVAGGISTTVQPQRNVRDPDPATFLGYSVFFAACCLAGAVGGVAVSLVRRRR